MQRVKQLWSSALADTPTGLHKGFRVSACISAIITILLATATSLMISLLTGQQVITHASTLPSVNMNCTLVVPNDPLTAQGLATPYLLKATNPAMGPCIETNPMQAAFVQAAVVNPATGFLAVYNPLVITQGTRPAIRPIIPRIPAGSVVGVWFGFNGAVLTLQGRQANTLADNHCVNGLSDSLFGQFAYCNAAAFFASARQAIREGKITPPALGKDRKGLTCPTTRSFFIVDQDQSDNVTTSYLIAPNGLLAQNTLINRQALPDATVLANPSDNALLSSVDATIGCTPWMRPDLANPGHVTAALPLNELQAAAYQPSPAALVPADDPMVLVNLTPNLTKLNLYRIGVDQPLAQSLQQASTSAYCSNLMNIAPPRLAIDAPLLGRGATPDAGVGNTLFTFMAQRYLNTFTNPLGEGLNCMKMFHLQPRVATVQTADGVAVAVLITVNGQTRCFNATGIISSAHTCTGATSSSGSSKALYPHL
jgi:hypothetical protein